MNQEVLSKDEVDALAEGVNHGSVSVGSSITEVGEAHTYDFLQPEHILKVKLPTLDLINERFAKAYQSGLFSLLHRSVEIVPQEVEVIKYSDYTNSLPLKTSINRVRISQLNGISLFNIDYKLVFMIVDSYFGGTGSSESAIPERDLTELEKRVVEKMLKLAFKFLEESWLSVAKVTFEILQTENRYQLSSAADPGDAVILSKFIFKMDEEESELHICIPYSMLEPVRPLLSAGVQPGYSEIDESWKEKLSEKVKQADVQIRCIFSTAEISLKDLLNMQAGDFIPIEMREETIVYADDVPLFKAKMGVSKDHAAIRFNKWCDESC